MLVIGWRARAADSCIDGFDGRSSPVRYTLPLHRAPLGPRTVHLAA